MAFTSGYKGAGSNVHHDIEVVTNDHTTRRRLPNVPGEDMDENKGDLWSLDINWFEFPPGTTCVLPTDITRISIVANGDDDWNIDSIATVAVMNNGQVIFLTIDHDVYEWIDSNGRPEYASFDLHNVVSQQNMPESGMHIDNMY